MSRPLMAAETSAMNLLDVRDLKVDISTSSGVLRAVRGINLNVGRGETLCMVGESGCGKSMAALALLGLLPGLATRTATQIVFNGRDLQDLTDVEMGALRGNEMGIIFQDPMTALNPCYTAGNQLKEGYLRHHRRATSKEAHERAIYMLERVGITPAEERLRQYPHQLSGGLRQRLLIAMALMCEPKLLIADEPTTALDVTIQAQILHLIKDLQEEFGIGVILITHDLSVVAQMADHVAVMYAGEVVEMGPVRMIFEAPRHPYTARLMQCIPGRDRARRSGRLGAIPGTVPSLLTAIQGCAFRSRCVVATDDCTSTIALHTEHERSWRCVHWRFPEPSQSPSHNGGA